MSDINQLNQRIVYFGLRRMNSSREEIKSGFDRWQQKFESQPLDVIEVVNDLVAYLGLEVPDKKALMIAMHSASAKLYNELEPVPEILLSGSTPASSQAEEPIAPVAKQSKAPELETLERFFQLSSQYLKRSDANAHRELSDIIAGEGLSSANKDVAKNLRDWAKEGLADIQLAKGLKVTDCQDLAHDYYVLLSEVIGPVNADVNVNKTIDELLLSETAQRFNPRELL